MIGYLRGQVMEHQDGRMLVSLAAGEGAIGYQVAVPHGPEYGAFAAGRAVELFVYTHVREDQLDLYGFVTRAEKELFLTLMTVNGIGPKGALGILSNLPAGALVTAILEGDKATLTKTPGIGKKTAERVVLELGDTLKKKIQAGLLAEVRARAPSGATSARSAPVSKEPTAVRDAREALLGLGYREQDVSELIERALESSPGPVKAEDLIRTALRRLG
jgi:Holliday junction DNA helicase RuvA